MAVTQVGSWRTGAGTGTAFPQTPTPGNALLLVTCVQSTLASPGTVATPAGYTLLVNRAYQPSNGVRLQVFGKVAAGAGETAPTLSGATVTGWAFAEYAGTDAAPFDTTVGVGVSGGGNLNGTGTINDAAITPSAAGLMVAAFASRTSATMTWAGGFSAGFSFANGLAAADRAADGSSSYTASGTVGGGGGQPSTMATVWLKERPLVTASASGQVTATASASGTRATSGAATGRVTATGTATAVRVGGLLAAYGCENSLADASGHGRTATLRPGASYTTGRYGRGVQSPSTGPSVATPALPLPGNPLTVSCWALASGTSDRAAVYIDYAGSEVFWTVLVGIIGGRWAVSGYSGNTGAASITGGTANAGVWTHLAVTLDADSWELTLYVDGVAVGTAELDPPDTDQPVYFGGQLGGTGFGVVDDLRVYDVARTAAQIVADRDTPLGVVLASAAGQVVATGSASGARGAVAAASGSVTAESSADATVIGYLTAAGSVTATGTASTTGVAPASAGGVVHATGTATAGVTSSAAAAGQVAATGQATAEVTVLPSAPATVTATGTTTGTGATSATAAAVVTATGTATAHGTVVTTAAAVVTATGTADPHVTTSTAAAAVVLAAGLATPNGTGTATGTVTADGTATAQVTSHPAATGSVTATGTASATGTTGAQATGTVTATAQATGGTARAAAATAVVTAVGALQPPTTLTPITATAQVTATAAAASTGQTPASAAGVVTATGQAGFVGLVPAEAHALVTAAGIATAVLRGHFRDLTLDYAAAGDPWAITTDPDRWRSTHDRGRFANTTGPAPWTADTSPDRWTATTTRSAP